MNKFIEIVGIVGLLVMVGLVYVIFYAWALPYLPK